MSRKNCGSIEDSLSSWLRSFQNPVSLAVCNSRVVVSQILGGHRRKLTRGFQELKSHYLFDHHFCNVRRTNEKAVVESTVKYARLNFFVPVPEVWDLTALNGYLLDRLSTQTSGHSLPTTLPEGFTPPRSISAYLKRDSDVQVRAFLNPWLSSDHSKVFLIDRRFAYVGGMNIGREYRYEWHDLMVELEGPIVCEFDRDFRRAWAYASALGDFAYAGSVLGGPRPEARCRDTRKSGIELRRLYTRTGALQIRKAVLEGIRRASSFVFLENPYLYENEVVAAFVRARRRGVDVRVVLPRGTDSP
jgi:hypothetical protein